LPHESNKRQKLLLEVVETGVSGLANRMVRFCRDRRQSEPLSSDFDEKLLLEPSGVWTVERIETQQLKKLGGG
jgi:hypothetical protein